VALIYLPSSLSVASSSGALLPACVSLLHQDGFLYGAALPAVFQAAACGAGCRRAAAAHLVRFRGVGRWLVAWLALKRRRLVGMPPAVDAAVRRCLHRCGQLRTHYACNASFFCERARQVPSRRFTRLKPLSIGGCSCMRRASSFCLAFSCLRWQKRRVAMGSSNRGVTTPAGARVAQKAGSAAAYHALLRGMSCP